MKKLPLIEIDQKTGLFTRDGVSLETDKLAVVILDIERSRQLYLARNSKGSEPLCYSLDGEVPVEPPSGPRKRYAMSDRCATCSYNQPKTKGHDKCQPRWGLIVLLPTGDVARVRLNTVSQPAIEQFVAVVNREIAEAKATVPPIELRLVDFALTLIAEKRPTMKAFGVKYPASFEGSVIRLPFGRNGRSKFEPQLLQYNREAAKEAAGLVALDELIQQGKQYLGPRKVDPSHDPAVVDDVIEGLIADI